MAQFEIGELAAFGASGEGGEAVAVDVGEPQLRAGVGAFLADDHPHPLRPAGQVQHAGDLCDPGAGPLLAPGVVGGGPGAGGHGEDGFLDLLGDGEPHGVGQAPSRRGEPGQEVVGAAAGVCADQHLAAQAAGQLRQGEPGGADVISGCVRAGVASPQHESQRLPGSPGAVISEDGSG